MENSRGETTKDTKDHEGFGMETALLNFCHPEPICWAKDLPEYLRLLCRFLALSPEFLAEEPGNSIQD
jgi:hypothetical protein